MKSSFNGYTKPFLDMSLHGSALRIYGILAAQADEFGRCPPMMTSEIAKGLGVCPRYIRRSISELCAKGYITRISKGYYSVPLAQPEKARLSPPPVPVEPPQPKPVPTQQGSTPRITISIFGGF